MRRGLGTLFKGICIGGWLVAFFLWIALALGVLSIAVSAPHAIVSENWATDLFAAIGIALTIATASQKLAAWLLEIDFAWPFLTDHE